MWFFDEEILEALSTSSTRTAWAETGAYEQFYEIERKLPKDLRDRSRIGALLIAEMHGTDGKNCWMIPVEGHKKILGPQNHVKLLEKSGEVFFEGQWGHIDFKQIETREEFYIWLAPREQATKAPIGFMMRVKGAFRLARHKLLGKKKN